MVEPLLILDSRERFRPCAVGTLYDVGATVGGEPIDLAALPNDPAARIVIPEGVTQPDVAPVGYRRLVDGGSLWWVQCWFFYLSNPKRYAGFGEHEGDWEMVQFGCRDPERNVPILATYSQHGGGEKREFWRVELDDGHPLVYVARDSHAMYFGPHQDVTDQADGKGSRLAMMWHEFGMWAEFPGRWGNSDNSPGPLMTRRAWQAAHAWHGQARG
jgi:hypothetical protein